MSTSTSTIAGTRRLVRFPRFDRTERVVHWSNATLFLMLLFTGASLKIAALSTIVANRHLVKDLHVYSGLLLPIPLLAGVALRSGAQLRRDLGRLNRWTADDRRWWSLRTRASAQIGKFNPGQKLNAAFIGASIVVMLMTGSIMKWFEPFPNSWRTGATFVHDSTWLALGIVIAGHILFALRDFDSLRAMVAGWVPESWARREHPRWWVDVVSARAASAHSTGRASADSTGRASADSTGRASAHSTGNVEAGAHEGIGVAGVGAGEMTVGDGVDGGAGDGLGGGEL
jgi:formate dehydrogenase subunit gamma